MGCIRFGASLVLAVGLSAGCTADPAKPTIVGLGATVDPTLTVLDEWDDYVMTDLGDFGGTYNVAVDINDAGTIVGVSAPTPGNGEIRRAWVSNGETLTMLPLLRPTASSATHAINAAGDIVGTNGENVIWSGGSVQSLRTTYPSLAVVRAVNSAGTMAGSCNVPRTSSWYACILDHGRTTLMDTTGFRSSIANAINTHGLVVGSRDAASEYSAYAWDAAGVLKLPFLRIASYQVAWASDVNDVGDVVGRTSYFLSWRATLWRNGVAMDLGAVHGYASWANGINARGDIVGASVPIFNGTQGNAHPALWRNGRLRLLPTGARRIELGEATAINSRGEIVGTLIYPTGERRAVIWRKG